MSAPLSARVGLAQLIRLWRLAINEIRLADCRWAQAEINPLDDDVHLLVHRRLRLEDERRALART